MMPDMHASPFPPDTSRSPVTQWSTRRYILGISPWFNIWVAEIKQLSSWGGWVGTSSYTRFASGRRMDSRKSHCSQPRVFVFWPIWSPETASQLRRGRKAFPSLVRRHQKTDRVSAGACSPPGEEHLSASVQLTNPTFINCLSFLLFPELHPAKVGRTSINECTHYRDSCHFLVQFRGRENCQEGKKGPAALPLEWTSSVWQISHSAERNPLRL